ncbi:hypothetical protein P154DRAFT_524673 [Amniculicola lignicola CBS 123094]|uniref:HTH araC/xylS-type domain-containing protein n=1 Tax=Amniculicola lignicola CBS 123094 TaxID=1392246 RepID=A0A6A5W6S0_9PLEO|nr:hypothetical protein P154DRAFT_524673 [Amniculicola lignicola CBS 123094]
MSYTTDTARWRALTVRDALANGQFVYSVKSTTIYCRPTCPARLARRANVGFYKTSAEAAAAGFRPCKRCKPEVDTIEDSQEHAVAKACSIINQALKDDNPKAFRLQDLATSVGLTPRYFHKIFKDKTGITPKEYAKVKAAEKEGARLPVVPSPNLEAFDHLYLDNTDIDALLNFKNDPTLSMENTSTTDDMNTLMPTAFPQNSEVDTSLQQWYGSCSPHTLVSGFATNIDRSFEQLGTDKEFDKATWDIMTPLDRLGNSTLCPLEVSNTYSIISPSLTLSTLSSSTGSPISKQDSWDLSMTITGGSPAALTQRQSWPKPSLLSGGRSTASLNDYDAMLMFDPTLAAFLVHDFHIDHPNSVI